ADQALPSPPAGLHRRGGRGDADAEAEAPRRRGALRARDRGALLELEPAAADERRRVPAAQRGDLDPVARVGRVNERATADVDADVPEAVEEDEVSRLELAHRDRAAVAVLRVRAVRERDADLRVDVHHEAGAVEPGRRGAAPDVRRAEVLHRDSHDAAMGGRRRGRRRRDRAAGADPDRRRERGLSLRGLLRGEGLALELRLPGGGDGLQVRDLALDRAEQLLALPELRLDRGTRRIALCNHLHLLAVSVLQEPLPVLPLAAEVGDLLEEERVLLWAACASGR